MMEIAGVAPTEERKFCKLTAPGSIPGSGSNKNITVFHPYKRKEVLNNKLYFVKEWINDHPPIVFEIRNGRDLYKLIHKVALLSGTEFSAVTRFIPGNYDKWRVYRRKEWSPKLETLQTVSQAFKVGIRVGFENGKIHPDFWVDGKEMNFSDYLESERKRKG